VTVTGRGIRKPQRDFLAAMVETGQPVMYRYGVYGGGLLLPVSRTGKWSRMIRQDLRRDQAMPAFLGSGSSGLYTQPKEPSGNLVVSDGIQYWWGTVGTGYRWKTDDIVDEPARLEMTLFWAGSSRVRKPHADVTIRRIQKFRLRPDWAYRYEIRTPAGELMEQGKVKPTRGKLLVINGVPVPPGGARLIVRP